MLKRRLSALLMAAAVFISGMPASAWNTGLFANDEEASHEPAATAVDAGELTNTMKLVQTGYDESTGVLTMTLKIKPVLGDGEVAGTGKPDASSLAADGVYIKEGAFMFQTDADTLVPITSPYALDDSLKSLEILRQSLSIAVVGRLPSGNDANTQLFDSTYGRGVTVANHFTNAMGTNDLSSSGNFVEGQTALLVTSTRTSETGKLDCYFQFQFNDYNAFAPVGEDGYIDVIDFYFQSKTRDSSGSLVNAASEEALFKNSLYVPQTEQEMEEIRSAFHAKSKYDSSAANGLGDNVVDTDSDQLAAGMGFRQKLSTGGVLTLHTAHYYFSQPLKTTWRFGTGNNNFWTSANFLNTEGDTAPGYYYTNMDKEYLITGFEIFNDNTYNYDTSNNPDFYVPSGEAASYTIPRYAAATKAQADENDQAGDWIPHSYVNVSTATSKKVPLKYYIRSEVSSNSVTSPETKLGLEEFLKGITWHFTFPDGTALDSVARTLTGDEYTVPTTGGNSYLVKEAEINEGHYTGYLLQEVYTVDGSGAETLVLVAPLGITLDSVESDVAYNVFNSDGELEEIQGRGLLPQIHMTTRAAYVDNYLWQPAANTLVVGQLFLVGSYQDSTLTAPLSARPIEMKFYREKSVAENVEIVFDHEVQNDENEQVKGFRLGVPYYDPDTATQYTLKAQDEVAIKGISFTATMYDQYGLAMRGSNRPTVTFTPDQNTYDQLKALKAPNATTGEEANPFEVSYNEPDMTGITYDDVVLNSYTIKYKESKTVNNALQGTYELRAAYGGKTAELDIAVMRDADRLSSISASVTGGIEGVPEDGLEVIDLQVPEADSAGAAVTKTVSVNIQELANQWRETEDLTQSVISDYDIVLGMRNTLASGNLSYQIDVDRAETAGITVSFTVEVPDSYKKFTESGAVDVTSQIDDGIITYNSSVDNGVTMDLKISAVRNSDTTQTVSKTYRLKFVKAASTLKRIVIKPPASVTVPNATASELQTTINAIPMDQYGTQVGWGGITAVGGGTWELKVQGTLPDGVTFTGSNNATMVVQPGADEGSVKVYAAYGSVESAKHTINIVREESKPTRVESISYGVYSSTSGIVSPIVGGDPVTVRPTIKIIDQYGEEMTTGYTLAWEFVNTVDSRITIDKNTGAITVAPTAPTTALTLRIRVLKDEVNALTPITYTNISVSRMPAVVSEVTVDQSSINYPLTTAITPISFTASYSSQYGEGDACPESDVTWVLLSSTLVDGTELVYGTLGTDSVTGLPTVVPDASPTITYSSSEYVARNLKLSNAGIVTFTAMTDPKQLPAKITVAARYRDVFSEPTEITVVRGDITPTEIYLPTSNNQTAITVPDEATGSVTRAFTAYVRDQYGVNMEEASVSWSIVGTVPTGVSIGTSGLTVTNKASTCTVTVKATHSFSLGVQQRTLEAAFQISINKPGAYVKEMSFAGVREYSGDTDITLPGVLSSAFTYTLQVNAKDQFGDNITVPMSWSIVDMTDGVSASITDAAAGKLSLSYSEEAKNSAQIDVKATVTNTTLDPSDPNYTTDITGTLDITLGPRSSAYAAIEAVSIPAANQSSEGDKVLLAPIKGDPAAQVTYTAQAYDQYEEPMSGVATEMKLAAPYAGTSFAMNTITQGTLSVDSTVAVPTLTVTAYVKGNETVRTGFSESLLGIDKGEGYPYATNPGTDAEDPEWDLPVWTTAVSTSNVPSPLNEVTYTLSAQVVDQYDTPFATGSGDTYTPRWQFNDPNGYTGVRFADGTAFDADGNAIGNTVSIVVSGNALTQAQRTGVIKVDVWCAQYPRNDEYFGKTISVTLKRDAPVPSYIYYEGADENGYVSVARPYASEGEKTYSVFPVLYDQYGVPFEKGSFDMLLDEDVLAGESVKFEKKYAQGESEEDGDSPISYTITDLNDVKIAEIDFEKGTLKLYNAFSLSMLHFTATSKDISGSGSTKHVYMEITSEARKPVRMELNENAYTIMMKRGQTEPVLQTMTATLYDQYGDVYGSTGVKTVWTLYMSDGVTPYKEYVVDADGNVTSTEKLQGDYILSKGEDTQRSTRLSVNSENFEKTIEAVLKCEVRTTTGALVSDITPISAKVTVRYAGSGVPVFLYVSFDPGEHGYLVGSPEQETTAGSPVAEAPGIKANPGFGFIGWTIDGKTLVDPLETPLYGDTVYVAVYRDISETAFIDGYGDGEVKPERRVTRAEFVKMAVRAFYPEFDENADYGRSFPDVSENAWYADYVAFAKSKGIVGGDETGNFRPGDNITRAEAAKVIVLAAGKKPIGGVSFSDINEYKWYAGYVEALYQMGVVGGYKDGTFKPFNYLTRAESVKIIVLSMPEAPNEFELENILNYAYNPFTDINRDHWAYPYILRAAGLA